MDPVSDNRPNVMPDPHQDNASGPAGEAARSEASDDVDSAALTPPESDIPSVSPPGADAGVERRMHEISRRSFLWSAAAVLSGYGCWRWLVTRGANDGLPWPLRRQLEVNERLAEDYFSPSRLSPSFPVSAAGEPRPNGDEGLPDDFDPAAWKLRVVGLAGSTKAASLITGYRIQLASLGGDKKSRLRPAAAPGGGRGTGSGGGAEDALLLGLDAIKALPKVEMVTELKCIEGWSRVVHWAGARFADFVGRYPPATQSGDPLDMHRRPQDLPPYVSLETPDGGYYVGLDMAGAMHPQTLLCYEMNGAPLTLEHGAPLRLVIPVKYGIKSIKSIGTIRFTTKRPADFWAEQGYDWYAGH